MDQLIYYNTYYVAEQKCTKFPVWLHNVPPIQSECLLSIQKLSKRVTVLILSTTPISMMPFLRVNESPRTDETGLAENGPTMILLRRV